MKDGRSEREEIIARHAERRTASPIGPVGCGGLLALVATDAAITPRSSAAVITTSTEQRGAIAGRRSETRRFGRLAQRHQHLRPRRAVRCVAAPCRNKRERGERTALDVAPRGKGEIRSRGYRALRAPIQLQQSARLRNLAPRVRRRAGSLARQACGLHREVEATDTIREADPLLAARNTATGSTHVWAVERSACLVRFSAG